MIKFGSARIDENGNILGGRAGDQTGREVCTENYYVHSQGWVILRAKSATLAKMIASAMSMACANDHIGYNQLLRNTLYTEAQKVGFDISKVTKNVNTDCSALVRVCLAYGGVKVRDFNTSSEKSVLLGSGQFDEVAFGGSESLYNGDILVTKTKGHTVVVVSGARERVVPKPTQPTSKVVNDYGVKYQAHVQTFGWLPEVRDGQISGTVGASKRLEAIKLTLPTGMSATIRAHIQGIGWREYECIGGKQTTIGTTGQSRRIEALEILKTSGIPSGKGLKMMAHVQTLGWTQNWTSIGVGTMGLSKRLEAIKFAIL